MAESKSFSISRKGYSCAEVDEFIASSEAAQAQLRESYASLQAKYDSLFEENGELIKEREQLRQGCKTMATALKQLRDNSAEDYKAKYEEAIAQLEKLKAETAEQPTDSSTATQMIEEVAQVVRRVESDARRKAEALTAAAKLEQTQAQLISSRVTEEVRSLIKMLEGFVADHLEIEETEE